MNILDLVVGKPIKTSDERAERIGPAQGIPIFGLDGQIRIGHLSPILGGAVLIQGGKIVAAGGRDLEQPAQIVTRSVPFCTDRPSCACFNTGFAARACYRRGRN